MSMVPVTRAMALLSIAALVIGVAAVAEQAAEQVAGAPTIDAGTDVREDHDDDEEDASIDVPSRLKDPPIATAKPLAKELDLLRAAKLESGRYVLRRDGSERVLTIKADLQKALTQILESYETPYAAVVALEPSTGRVLAMAEHSHADPSMRGLPVKAVFPAASIFKIVTGAALLDAGATADETSCFHGGKRRLSEKLLMDSPRDTKCYSLAQAMGMSANVVFAKMTRKYLSAERLLKYARAFRFNQKLDFAIPTDVSLAAVPEEPFELASTGAGFGDVYLSPLHGAAIAAISANEGRWRSPVLFEDQVTKDVAMERVLTPAQSKALTEMLEATVTQGTARRIFRQREFRVPGAVGKTGSLADRRPFRDYSWFVGFAPKEDPKVAVAAVVVNEMKWRIRATWLGREALRLGLEEIDLPVASSE